MVKRAEGVDDLELVMSTRCDFEDDVTEEGWLVGKAGRLTLHVRMGDFPDEEAWSLWLGDGRWMDFTECPSNWSITLTPGGWPASARPRLPKGEFYE